MERVIRRSVAKVDAELVIAGRIQCAKESEPKAGRLPSFAEKDVYKRQFLKEYADSNAFLLYLVTIHSPAEKRL